MLCFNHIQSIWIPNMFLHALHVLSPLISICWYVSSCFAFTAGERSSEEEVPSSLGSANKAIYGGVHRWSITQNGWFTMEILLNIDDLGAPQFMETTISKRIIGTQIRWNQSWCPPKLMSISNMPQPSTCFQHLSVLRPAYDLAEEAEDPNSTRAQAHANPKKLRNFSY